MEQLDDEQVAARLVVWGLTIGFVLFAVLAGWQAIELLSDPVIDRTRLVQCGVTVVMIGVFITCVHRRRRRPTRWGTMALVALASLSVLAPIAWHMSFGGPDDSVGATSTFLISVLSVMSVMNYRSPGLLWKNALPNRQGATHSMDEGR
ncbi:hypothetical protein [Stackebrandtia soli]|uniref:hypothetical protein n=1 Tax=Stackebrandtia soli TaxID=1892856 RepID=UPI0039E751A1